MSARSFPDLPAETHACLAVFLAAADAAAVAQTCAALRRLYKPQAWHRCAVLERATDTDAHAALPDSYARPAYACLPPAVFLDPTRYAGWFDAGSVRVLVVPPRVALGLRARAVPLCELFADSDGWWTQCLARYPRLTTFMVRGAEPEDAAVLAEADLGLFNALVRARRRNNGLRVALRVSLSRPVPLAQYNLAIFTTLELAGDLRFRGFERPRNLLVLPSLRVVRIGQSATPFVEYLVDSLLRFSVNGNLRYMNAAVQVFHGKLAQGCRFHPVLEKLSGLAEANGDDAVLALRLVRVTSLRRAQEDGDWANAEPHERGKIRVLATSLHLGDFSALDALDLPRLRKIYALNGSTVRPVLQHVARAPAMSSTLTALSLAFDQVNYTAAGSAILDALPWFASLRAVKMTGIYFDVDQSQAFQAGMAAHAAFSMGDTTLSPGPAKGRYARLVAEYVTDPLGAFRSVAGSSGALTPPPRALVAIAFFEALLWTLATRVPALAWLSLSARRDLAHLPALVNLTRLLYNELPAPRGAESLLRVVVRFVSPPARATLVDALTRGRALYALSWRGPAHEPDVLLPLTGYTRVYRRDAENDDDNDDEDDDEDEDDEGEVRGGLKSWCFVYDVDRRRVGHKDGAAGDTRRACAPGAFRHRVIVDGDEEPDGRDCLTDWSAA